MAQRGLLGSASWPKFQQLIAPRKEKAGGSVNTAPIAEDESVAEDESQAFQPKHRGKSFISKGLSAFGRKSRCTPVAPLGVRARAPPPPEHWCHSESATQGSASSASNAVAERHMPLPNCASPVRHPCQCGSSPPAKTVTPIIDLRQAAGHEWSAEMMEPHLTCRSCLSNNTVLSNYQHSCPSTACGSTPRLSQTTSVPSLSSIHGPTIPVNSGIAPKCAGPARPVTRDGLDVFMLYASPIDRKYRPINIRAEVEAIQEALADSAAGVRLHVGVATAESLTKILTLSRRRKGLVLHLSVHAITDPEKGLGLVLEDSRGRPHILWRQNLEEILGGPEGTGQSPSLVFLSACWSQELAQVFVEYDCPHVVSLRTQVNDTAARKFAQHFYLSLAVGTPLLGAWESARRALRVNPDRILADQADSFMLFGQQGADKMTLSTLCGKNDVASTGQGAPAAAAPQSDLGWSIRELEHAEVYLDAKLPPRPQDIVGRTEDSIKVMTVMHGRRVCVVHGPEGIGKSALGLEVAHFASSPGRFFSCSARVVRLETGNLSAVVSALEEAIESLAVDLHVHPWLWSGHSNCPSSARSTTPSLGSLCSECAFPIADESSSEPLEQVLPAVQRMRRALQQVERTRRTARILLVVDDVVGVVSSCPEVHRVLGELLEHTYRLHVLVCSREPIYQCFGNTKAVNLPLTGLTDQDGAWLLLQRIHRMLGPRDFVPQPPTSGTSLPVPRDVRGGGGHIPTTTDEALRQLRGHPLLQVLGGNPGAIRAVSAQVHEGGPSLQELAAALPHRISVDGLIGGSSAHIGTVIGSAVLGGPTGISRGGPYGAG